MLQHVHAAMLQHVHAPAMYLWQGHSVHSEGTLRATKNHHQTLLDCVLT